MHGDGEELKQGGKQKACYQREQLQVCFIKIPSLELDFLVVFASSH